MKKITVRVDGTSDRRVKNPKTTAQTLQRVLVKAVGLAYAMLKFKQIETALKRPFSYPVRHRLLSTD